MDQNRRAGFDRVLAALSRHLEDQHGFRGLRLQTVSRSGAAVGYRLLPAPYAGPDQKLRLVALDQDGRPRTPGTRRVTTEEAVRVLGETLAETASGQAASATRTAGLEARFGPGGIKIVFRNPAAVAPLIPLDDPSGHWPAPPPRLERALVEGSTTAELLSPSEAGPLLAALGLLSPGGQVRRDERRKYNQITHFLRLLEGLVNKLPAGREAVVVDCGCGKSQLLFVLNYWLTERLGRRAYCVGLDSEPKAIAAATRLQGVLGYRNMEFHATSIAGWASGVKPDLVLSLHACDTATDEAIVLGVRAGASGIVAVPCCQHEIAPQIRQDGVVPLLGHPILLDRLGDWLTDGLRVLALEALGYVVDVVEYVSPLDTPKNIMLRAGKARRPDRRAYERYLAVRDFFGVSPALDDLLAGLWPVASP
jgi:hypothetical protein